VKLKAHVPMEVSDPGNDNVTSEVDCAAQSRIAVTPSGSESEVAAVGTATSSVCSLSKSIPPDAESQGFAASTSKATSRSQPWNE
jgi:hypothetical protein